MSTMGRETFRSVFKVLCVVSVSFMVAYWLYKFKIEDRDIGLVDYVLLDENREAKLPVVSLCFTNPFINAKISHKVSEINATEYLKYLKGETFDERFRTIDYGNVTMNLEKYFLYGQVKLLNETDFRNDSTKFVQKEIFSGIERYADQFTKCFAVEMHSNDDVRPVNVIRLFYDMGKMLADLGARSRIPLAYDIHYPGKYLDRVNHPKQGWISNKKVYHPKQGWIGNGFHVIIYDMEVLKRRNSQNRKCLDDQGRYDDLAMERQIETVGCRAPYQRPHKEYPICNSQKKIQKALYKYMVAAKLYPTPCERISKIHFDRQYQHYESFGNNTWIYYLSYPNGIKIISQSKEIDGHSLIGNIGGYIGLFLGKID